MNMKKIIMLLTGCMLLAVSACSVEKDGDIFKAVAEGDVASAKAKLNKGIEVSVTNEAGKTPLLVASENGQVETMELLISKGAKVDRVVSIMDPASHRWEKATALSRAVVKKQKKAAEFLLENKADINKPGYRELTPLCNAAIDENQDMVAWLLKKGAKINTRGTNGETALMAAAGTGNLELVKFLIEKGADKTIKDDKGKTAADWAKEFKHTRVAEYLGS